MVQIASKFGEFCPSQCLSSLTFFLLLLYCIPVEVLLEFLILTTKCLQLLLTFVEVVLVLADPVPLIHLLDKRGLLREEVETPSVELLLLTNCKALPCIVRPEGCFDSNRRRFHSEELFALHVHFELGLNL